MVHCYMCDKDVEKFKTNSHVIPKCLLKPIKENGKYVLVDNVKKENKYTGNEIIGNFICDACEKKTRKDDAFAKEFFIDKKFFEISTTRFMTSDGLIDLKNAIKDFYEFETVEVFEERAFQNFKLFVLSVLLREYCYQKVTRNTAIIPDHHLEKLRNIYHYINIYDLDSYYPIMMNKEILLDTTTFYPYKTRNKGINSLKFMVMGYRILTYIDKREISNICFRNNIITKDNFKCFVLKYHPRFIKSIKKSLNNNEKLGNLRNKN